MEPELADTLDEAEVRRQLDLAIGRAMVDADFAAELLAEPTIGLGDAPCSAEQRQQLRRVRAETLREFAAQVEALFWPSAGPARRPRGEAERLALVDANGGAARFSDTVA